MRCDTCERVTILVERTERLLEEERKVREARIPEIIQLREDLAALRSASGDAPGLLRRMASLEETLIDERNTHDKVVASIHRTHELEMRAVRGVRILSPADAPEFTVHMSSILRRATCSADAIKNFGRRGEIRYHIDGDRQWWFKPDEITALLRDRFNVHVDFMAG